MGRMPRLRNAVLVVLASMPLLVVAVDAGSSWGWSLAGRSSVVIPRGINGGSHDNIRWYARPPPPVTRSPPSLSCDNQTNLASIPRGGHAPDDALVVPTVVRTLTNALTVVGKTILPPTVSLVKAILAVYRRLPKDAILAQIGLVYCFAGGYYPTLFSSLQAAQQYGWTTMTTAVDELVEEAVKAIVALDEQQQQQQQSTVQMEEDDHDEPETRNYDPSSKRQRHRRSHVWHQTTVVLATVDPNKINQAVAALTTTWLGVSSVLQQEYARVITLSWTMSDVFDSIFQWLCQPPLYWVIPEPYHQWVPVLIGWACKATAMTLAWRIQRLMTAASSAMAGGVMVARAGRRMMARWISKHRKGRRRRGSSSSSKWFGRRRRGKPNHSQRRSQEVELEETYASSRAVASLEELVGCLIAGLGFYTQFESQWRSGFSFRVPFPMNLITWPFDVLERWIQWQITNKK